MAENENVTTRLSVDVTDFKKGLADANRYIRLANSEFEKATAGAGKFTDSADGLRAKLTQLEKTLEGQEAAAAVLRKEYEKVCQEQGENSKGAQELAIKLNKQEAACKKTASQIDKYQNALDDMERTADDAGDEAQTLGKNLDDVASSAKKADKATDGVGKDMPSNFSKAAKAAGNLARNLASVAGKAVVNGIKSIGVAAGGLLTGFLATGETSKEWTGNMNKLAAVAQESGRSTQAVKKQFTEFYGILGDETAATTTASNLEAIGLSEKNLATVTNSMTGIWAKYGDSIPLDGLAESINETSRVGQVTGNLADALNWAGISEDQFNEKLAACSSEQERQQLIVDTLDGAYGSLGNTYKETNADIIESNKANAELQDALAGVGSASMPVMSALKMMGASILKDLLPGIKELGTAFRGVLDGKAGAAADLGTALSGILTNLLGKITEMAPQLIQVASSLITSLVSSLSAMAPEIVSVGMSLITSLCTTLLGMLPQLVDTGLQLIVSIITGISQALPQIGQAIADMIPQLAQALQTGLPLLIKAAVDLVSALAGMIDQILPPLIAALPGLIMSLCTALVDSLPILLDACISLLNTLVSNIGPLVQALLPMIPKIITMLLNSLADNIPTILTAILDLVIMIATQVLPVVLAEIVKAIPQILKAIVSGLGKILASILKWCGQLLVKIGTWIGQLVGKAKEAGSKFLNKIVEFFKQLPGKVWTWLSNVIAKVGTWAGNLVTKAREAGSKFLNKIVEFFKQLPGKVWTWLSNVITKVTTWAGNLATKARTAGSKFVTGAVNAIKGLPGKVWTWLSNTVAKVGTWGSNMLTKAKAGMRKVVSGVTETLKGLPQKVLSIGKNLVSGLWNGINDKLSWLKSKISGFASSVLDGIKDFFGINSPSTVMRDEVGKWLPAGLAEGVTRNTRTATRAMADMARDALGAANTEMSGGLRSLVNTSGTTADGSRTGSTTYVFNQYNNSPKALSRAEIYRQTKNQLRFATQT